MKSVVATIFASLVEFEERAASLYLTFARRFTDKKDLSWFWLQMSMEERQHALLLKFAGCEGLAAVENLPDRKTIQKISILFGDLEKRVKRKDLSISEAFLIAAEIEGSEINNIYADVIKPMPGTSYLMKKKIETLIPDHIQVLFRGARKFGASAATVAKLVEIKRRQAPKGQ